MNCSPIRRHLLVFCAVVVAALTPAAVLADTAPAQAATRPLHQISGLAHPTYARHISLAQNYFGLPSQLTRTTNSALIDSNRRVACTDPQGRPRPPGKSCDEYPFATTYQGASLQPYGRTITMVGGINGSNPGFFCMVPWLQTRQLGDSGGFSACMITDTENSDGGTLLGLFYYDNRVIERDEFIVRVI